MTVQAVIGILFNLHLPQELQTFEIDLAETMVLTIGVEVRVDRGINKR